MPTARHFVPKELLAGKIHKQAGKQVVMKTQQRILDHYDVVIVGAGPSGTFSAYETKKINPAARILIIEKGHSIEKRRCPKRKSGVCAKCNPCNITTGFSGGGSFSDGKLSINDAGEIGGDLAAYIGLDKFRQILRYTDELYVHFGADCRVYGSETSPASNAIHRSAAQAHLRLIDSRVRHMGTEKAYDIYARIEHELESLGIDKHFQTNIQNLHVLGDGAGLTRGLMQASMNGICMGRILTGNW